MTDRIPLKEVLNGNKIEESWGKDIPESGVGANAPVEPEFNREKAIEAAVLQTQRLRDKRMAMGQPTQIIAPFQQPRSLSEAELARNQTKASSVEVYEDSGQKLFYFFVVKKTGFEIVGCEEMDDTVFRKDLSGRLFRAWLKETFPGRKDYTEITCFEADCSIQEVMDGLGLNA